ncbi:hypothetical protein HELRODRAFT_161299 [Helobdella robusta]|uniref:Uncharacterized protein n=1 Tax=Helobdella robusta TaxID=6412 RepID=T1ERB2_HELRO|nr:hypothetical protein HELRODRAFT_161299 [Helobdella robusta]ESO02072.1 hypothetical protein HELRODRAFT_161299 [Helobdella robusta]
MESGDKRRTTEEEEKKKDGDLMLRMQKRWNDQTVLAIFASYLRNTHMYKWPSMKESMKKGLFACKRYSGPAHKSCFIVCCATRMHLAETHARVRRRTIERNITKLFLKIRDKEK